MCMEWMEIIGNSTDQKAVINVPSWLSRATLDAIGQGTTVTTYDTDASHTSWQLHLTSNSAQSKMIPTHWSRRITISCRFFGIFSVASMELCALYRNDVFGQPSVIHLFTREIFKYLPTYRGSNPLVQRIREMTGIVTEVARELVHEKAESLLAGKGRRDIFSLLGW